ncbi:hypothetical protein DFH09DRAFT_1107396, partial [Mycena vulgaris]
MAGTPVPHAVDCFDTLLEYIDVCDPPRPLPLRLRSSLPPARSTGPLEETRPLIRGSRGFLSSLSCLAGYFHQWINCSGTAPHAVKEAFAAQMFQIASAVKTRWGVLIWRSTSTIIPPAVAPCTSWSKGSLSLASHSLPPTGPSRSATGSFFRATIHRDESKCDPLIREYLILASELRVVEISDALTQPTTGPPVTGAPIPTVGPSTALGDRKYEPDDGVQLEPKPTKAPSSPILDVKSEPSAKLKRSETASNMREATSKMTPLTSESGRTRRFDSQQTRAASPPPYEGIETSNICANEGVLTRAQKRRIATVEDPAKPTPLLPPPREDNADVDWWKPPRTYGLRGSSTVLAWLIPDGDQVHKQIYVRVPLLHGVLRASSVAQVDSEMWIDASRGIGEASEDLTPYTFHVDRYPLDEPRDLMHSWSFVVTPQDATGHFAHPINSMINRLVPDLAKPWRGNVLIYRHGKTAKKMVVGVETQYWIAMEWMIATVFRENIVKSARNDPNAMTTLPVLQAHRMWAISEVVLYTLRYLDLIHILNFSHVSKRWKALANAHLRGRILRYTAPFFNILLPDPPYPGQLSPITLFFRTLERTSSWIVGSVALASSSNLSDPASPNNLNIITFDCYFVMWLRLMGDILGFNSPELVAATGAYERVAGMVLRYEHPTLPGLCISFTFTSRAHLGHLFFAAPNTDQLIAISSFCIITPYLYAVAEQRHIQGWRPTNRRHPSLTTPLDETYRSFSAFPGAIVLDESTQDWDRACGLICPGLRRSTFGLSGFARIRWGGHNGEVERDDPALEHATVMINWHRTEFSESDVVFGMDAIQACTEAGIFRDNDYCYDCSSATLASPVPGPTICGPSPPSELTADQACAHGIVERHLGQTLENKTPNQLFLLVRGSPGSGKSALLLAFAALFATKNASTLFAKTGCSPLSSGLIGAVTVHAWADVPFRRMNNTNWLQRITPEAQARIISASYLAIDQCSLMDSGRLDQLEARLAHVRTQANPAMAGVPFGGMNILLFGDMLQTPISVNANDSLYHAGLLTPPSSAGARTYRLFHTVVSLASRQAINIYWDSLLQDVRAGRFGATQSSTCHARVVGNSALESLDFYAAPWCHAPLVASRRSVVAEWNGKALLKHRRVTGNPIYVLRARDSVRGASLPSTGNIAKAIELHSSRMTGRLPTFIRVAIGARVVLFHHPLTSFGVVINIEPDPWKPTPSTWTTALDHEGGIMVVPISRTVFSIYGNGVEVGTTVVRTQLRLRLAFAMLTQEAEGQSFDRLFLDLAKPPARGHNERTGYYYTAWNRTASDALSIYASPQVSQSDLRLGTGLTRAYMLRSLLPNPSATTASTRRISTLNTIRAPGSTSDSGAEAMSGTSLAMPSKGAAAELRDASFRVCNS